MPIMVIMWITSLQICFNFAVAIESYFLPGAECINCHDF